MSTKLETNTKTGLDETKKDANTSPSITKDKKPAEIKHKAKAAPPKESEATNPTVASIEAIKISLADGKKREDFLDNVADLISSYTRRKIDPDEKQSLKNLVDNELISKVFKIKKLAA